MFASRVRILATTGLLFGALTASTVSAAFAAPDPNVNPPAVVTNVGASGGQTSPNGKAARSHFWAFDVVQGMGAKLASLFGISTQTLRQQLSAGQTLAQIAAANGKTAADVESTLLAALKSKLDAAVAAGRISSERETTILAQAPNHIAKLTNRNLAPLLQRIQARHERRGQTSAPAATAAGQ
jgi:hypothetical protein